MHGSGLGSEETRASGDLSPEEIHYSNTMRGALEDAVDYQRHPEEPFPV